MLCLYFCSQTVCVFWLYWVLGVILGCVWPFVAVFEAQTSLLLVESGLFKWKLSVILGIYAVFVFLSTDCWCIFVGCLVTAGVRNSSSMVKLPLTQCIGIQ